MIRGFFENPMISNGRIVCDCCSQPIWEDEKPTSIEELMGEVK